MLNLTSRPFLPPFFGLPNTLVVGNLSLKHWCRTLKARLYFFPIPIWFRFLLHLVSWLIYFCSQSRLSNDGSWYLHPCPVEAVGDVTDCCFGFFTDLTILLPSAAAVLLGCSMAHCSIHQWFPSLSGHSTLLYWLHPIFMQCLWLIFQLFSASKCIAFLP